MKQATLNLDLSAKKTRKQVFLDQMDQVVPWAALVELIGPLLPRRSQRQTAVFFDDDAAHPLHAAMVHFV